MLKNLHWWHCFSFIGMALSVMTIVMTFPLVRLEFTIWVLVAALLSIVPTFYFFIRRKHAQTHSPSNDESEVRGTARPSA